MKTKRKKKKIPLSQRCQWKWCRQKAEIGFDILVEVMEREICLCCDHLYKLKFREKPLKNLDLYVWKHVLHLDSLEEKK